MAPRPALASLLLLTLACGGAVESPADAGPTSLAALQALVRGGGYLGWPAEAAVHPSAGPHGGAVRTFVNPALYASLKAGATAHPPGSAVVKERRSGGALTGYAADVKGEDGGWTFFEGVLPGLDQYYYQGTANLCGDCHRAGVDYVLTPAAALP